MLCKNEACSRLTSVTIPNSVTSIGNYVFYDCTKLASITSLIKNPFEIGYEVFHNVPATATLYVPEGTKKKYEVTAGWDWFQNIVELNEVPTAIDDAIAHGSETTVMERYDLSGQRVAIRQHGVNIVRMSDGTTRKVMVK